MPAGLAQEELQRVGRRLERLGAGGGVFSGGGSGSASRSGSTSSSIAAPVELRVDGFDLERVELERLEQLDQLDLPQLAARLRRLEQRRELLADEDRLDLDGRYWIPLIGAPGRCSRLVTLPKHADPLRVKSNAR